MSTIHSRVSWNREAVLSLFKLTRKEAILASLALATGVAVVDYWTGDELPLIICYLPTIAVMCWVSNLAVAASLAMVCCTGWLIDDLILLDDPGLMLTRCWTALAHLLFYLVVICVLTRLRHSHVRAETLARTDSLTGLMNRKGFREAACLEVERMRRTGTSLAVAYIDCDNFKTVNDTHSHAEGDSVLTAIGNTMREDLRTLDSIARIGGDEFAILLPGTSAERAKIVMDRLRDQLGGVMAKNGWPVTFSIGVAIYDRVPQSVDDLISAADALMFHVKHRQEGNGIACQVWA